MRFSLPLFQVSENPNTQEAKNSKKKKQRKTEIEETYRDEVC
jgi:hypothetical protein